jgi:multisubunit Na+/H+ antiporter MnhB subunit
MATDEGGFGDIFDLTFTKFVTPTVIRVLFILVIVFSALWWLFLVIAGFSSSAGGGLTALILGGLGFIIFVLLYRVFFELVMVIFRIKDNTDRAADALDRGAGT